MVSPPSAPVCVCVWVGVGGLCPACSFHSFPRSQCHIVPHVILRSWPSTETHKMTKPGMMMTKPRAPAKKSPSRPRGAPRA